MGEEPVTLYQFFAQEKEAWQKGLAVLESREKMAQLKAKVVKEVKVNWPIAFDIIAEKIADVLNITIPDIIVKAWKKYGILLDYADGGKYFPDETLVPLGEHTIKSEHHPSIEVLINSKKITEVKFDVSISLVLKSAVIKIRDGKIMGATMGTCKGGGTVKCEDVVIMQRETGPIVLPGSIDFGEGIPIVTR